MTPIFTTDCTTDLDGYRPTAWLRTLSRFRGRDNLSMLEVGSHEGRSVLWFFEHILTGEGCRATCIDPWFNPEYYDHFVHNTAGLPVTVIRAESENALPKLRDEFDIIYIDGDHHAAPVLFDGCFAWPLLKQGGAMIFDDYLIRPSAPPKRNPLYSIERWMALHRDQFRVLENGYQIIVEKL